MSTVEQIKSRLSVTDVVQAYIKLQKSGSQLQSQLPFSQRKTPSFFVSPARQSWHCFGCSHGGDMFSFIMEIEGVDFFGVFENSGRPSGSGGGKNRQKNSKTKDWRLLQLMDESAKFYETELRKTRMSSLTLKKRDDGRDGQIFGVGFAPAGWRNL